MLLFVSHTCLKGEENLKFQQWSYEGKFLILTTIGRFTLVPKTFEESHKIHFLLECLDSTYKLLLLNVSIFENYER